MVAKQFPGSRSCRDHRVTVQGFTYERASWLTQSFHNKDLVEHVKLFALPEVTDGINGEIRHECRSFHSKPSVRACVSSMLTGCNGAGNSKREMKIIKNIQQRVIQCSALLLRAESPLFPYSY